MAVYLDSSATVKLVVREPESLALRRYLRRKQPLVSSALARTEVLRSLDAIHLATAGELGDELSAVVTYDDRMAAAARHLGQRVVQPR